MEEGGGYTWIPAAVFPEKGYVPGEFKDDCEYQDQLYLEEPEEGQDLLLPPSNLQGGFGEDEIFWLEQGEED